MPIRQLPQTVINRIAAGEVVERPASVVKELVENAIDAGARSIEVVTADGGLSLIRVTDDGCGMDARDLALSVERHATSKLDEGDLTHIATLGFRGEALPSIGSVARLALISRPFDAREALEIRVDGGVKSGIRPAALMAGTRVEVRDLFYATPARLKFMKSERAENSAISDVVKRLALARPGIAFHLTTGERAGLSLSAVMAGDAAGLRQRLARIMGSDFAEDAIPFATTREDIRIEGFAGLPTLNRPDAGGQFLFVNGRPVKDKLVAGAVKAAYGDLCPRGRHPMLALFIDLPPERVDVNVHPAKAELRFRDGALVRALIIGALRNVLAQIGPKTSHTLGSGALAAMRKAAPRLTGFAEPAANPVFTALGQTGERRETEVSVATDQAAASDDNPGSHFRPLGVARAQFHDNYIFAETEDGIVIVDQHAAHERLVYERMKAALANGGVERQVLLIPQIVELEPEDAAALVEQAGDFARLGLILEAFGPGAVIVREMPALFGQGNTEALIRDLAHELADSGESFVLTERLYAICAKFACYGSVRSGRRLSQAEMDALLRQMEATPNSGQCNHGRPTYIELKRADIERLFGRR